MDVAIATRQFDLMHDLHHISAMVLREADKRELNTLLGEGDANALLVQHLAHSQGLVWIAFMDGEPFAVFGVEPTEEPMLGVVWAMGTDKITTGGLPMIAWGIEALGKCHDYFPILHNIVDSRNEVHIKWLKSMKFQFTKADMDINGTEFLHFARVRF